MCTQAKNFSKTNGHLLSLVFAPVMLQMAIFTKYCFHNSAPSQHYHPRDEPLVWVALTASFFRQKMSIWQWKQTPHMTTKVIKGATPPPHPRPLVLPQFSCSCSFPSFRQLVVTVGTNQPQDLTASASSNGAILPQKLLPSSAPIRARRDPNLTTTSSA